jgi:tRNA (guanine-N7-)-methyltransferase
MFMPIIVAMENTNTKLRKQRQVRSYVLRTGRMTTGQQRALEELWPRYGIDSSNEKLDLAAVFARRAQVVLEIGFGNGDSLVEMAAKSPAVNFLGVEVHEPGVGHCLMRIEALGLGNVRLVRQDAVEFIAQRLQDESLVRVNLFFPDPWHKKRHHKRRIVQPGFVDLVLQKLEAEGVFHIATDWPDYAEHIAATVGANSGFVALQDVPADRVITKFDIRGQRLGHQNWERAWCKRSKLPKRR